MVKIALLVSLLLNLYLFGASRYYEKVAKKYYDLLKRLEVELNQLLDMHDERGGRENEG